MKKQLTSLLLSLAVLVCGAVGITTLAANAEEQQTIVGSDKVIGSVKGDDDGFVTESEWDTVYQNSVAGDNGITVKYVLVGTNLFFRAVINDETHFDGKERFAYSVKVGSFTKSSQGHFELDGNGSPTWDASEGAPAIYNERPYDEENKRYIMTVGLALGENCVKGATAEVSFTYVDATTADTAWGAGTSTNTFSASFVLLGEEGQEEPVEDEYTYVVPMISGAPSASDWESAEAYKMTPVGETTGATGTVGFIVGGSTLYFRINVSDATQLVVNGDGSTNDRPEFKFTLGGKSQRQRGKYVVGWMPATESDFGTATLYEENKGDGTYTVYAGYEIGDLAVKGAWLTVDFSHADAQTDGDGWADSYASYPHAIRFAGTLYFGEVSEEDALAKEPEDPEPQPEPDPDPTEGPENTDLGIVITDLLSMPTESDWKNATAYELIKLHGNSEGATGTFKVYTASQNIFYRIEVADATTNCHNDGVYIRVSGFDEEDNEVVYYEGRGNYESWIATITNEFGSPSLFTQTTTASEVNGYGEGQYTFSQGFYMPAIYGVGNKIRIVIKHRDSRSASEGWADGDYFHTVYFDQVMTFGPEADRTVRPQEATEGFTGASQNVSYNKAELTWSEVENAETYKLYIYKVNAEGSEEPYEHVSVEGPVYSGGESDGEPVFGLSESTAYAVQVVAYDENEEVIAYSGLVTFSTISREEAMQQESDSEQDSGSEQESGSGNESAETPSASDGENGGSSEETKKGGCSGSVAATAALIPAMLAAAVVLKKKEDL